MTFEECCRTVWRECPDLYAKSYAYAGLGMEGKEAQVQALYILSNMSRWRGDVAKTVRADLKRIAKG